MIPAKATPPQTKAKKIWQPLSRLDTVGLALVGFFIAATATVGADNEYQ